MEVAAQPAIGSLQGPDLQNQKASSMEMTSSVKKSDSELHPNNGCLLRPQPCPQEDRTPRFVSPQLARTWKIQHQGPSVLETKVRVLKEKMTAGREGASPCPTTSPRPSSRKSKCRRVKVTGTPSEGSSGPEAMVVHPAQNLTDRQLDRSTSEENPARNGDSRLPKPPDPGLKCWNERSVWPPEALGTLHDHGRGLLRENSTHMAIAGHPGGPGPCNIIHMAHPRKGRPHSIQGGLVMGGDLDSMPSVSEDFVPRPALMGGLWRAGELEALGTESCTLSLSDRVERNRLLLHGMLATGGQGPLKLGNLAWAPSWDRVVPEQPVGDVDWDSGIYLQDLDKNRIFGPQSGPMLNTGHEEGKHLPQHMHMKARTRPLRANHDIVPNVTQGNRGSGRNPGLTPRRPLACRDSLHNGNTSDSSSGESSSGQWPRRGSSPSHVRFQDESALDAESRYLERFQQRCRPELDQGLLRSKPDLTQYFRRSYRRINEDVLLRRIFPVKPAQGSQKKCRACGNCLNSSLPAPGRASPDWKGPPEYQTAARMESVQGEPPNFWVLSSPHRFHSADQGLRTEGIRETHTGDPLGHLEEVDSARDSTDTSDSGRTDNEEARTTKPSRATAGSPSLKASKPRGGFQSLRKTDKESPRNPQTLQPSKGFDLVQDVDELKEDQEYIPQGTVASSEDASSKPPILEAEQESRSQRQLGPVPQNLFTQLGGSQAPCKASSALTSAMKLGSSVPGRQAQDRDSNATLKTISLSPSHLDPPTLPQPIASLSSEVWMPTPPTLRKTPSSTSHRKALLTRPRGPRNKEKPEDIPLSSLRNVVLRTQNPTPSQTQPRNPHIRHPMLALTMNNCNNSVPQVLLESQGGSLHHDMVEKGLCNQELECPLKNPRDGELQSLIDPAADRIAGASEKPECNQELDGDLQREESRSREPVSSQIPSGLCGEPGVPSAPPSDRSKKSTSSSIASTLGLKKLFSALGHGSRLRVGKSRSYSVEQLQTPTPGTPKAKRAPSLQFLHLVSHSHQHRKAASFQNIHALLSGKVDRSSLYLVKEPGDEKAAGRPAEVLPRRTLSVEDVSAPSQARTVGRVVEVFPDGTSQLQLQRSLGGTFGFCVASGNGRRDSGFYVQEMADRDTAKLYSGLLGVGDEILEVNGAKVAGLGLAHVQELLAHADSLSLRVLRQRPGLR